MLLETNNAGDTQVRYTHGLGLISQKLTSSSTPHYHHFEAIGTTRQLTRDTQDVTDTYTMDAWGNSLASSGTTMNAFKYVAQQNYYTDGQSGLMLLGVRYYEAGVGRFLVLDPRRENLNWNDHFDNRINLDSPERTLSGRGRELENGGEVFDEQEQFNWYVYSRSNPVSLIDASGLAAVNPNPERPIPCMMGKAHCPRAWNGCKKKGINTSTCKKKKIGRHCWVGTYQAVEWYTEKICCCYVATHYSKCKPGKTGATFCVIEKFLGFEVGCDTEACDRDFHGSPECNALGEGGQGA